MEKEQDVTRREFLKTAATTVAAASSLAGLAAPGILSAQSAGNPVRYGFIGPGTEGCTLLKFLATIPEGHCIAHVRHLSPQPQEGRGDHRHQSRHLRRLPQDVGTQRHGCGDDCHAAEPCTRRWWWTRSTPASTCLLRRRCTSRKKKATMIRKAMADHPSWFCKWDCSGGRACSTRWPWR